jgi:hypothetical protein
MVVLYGCMAANVQRTAIASGSILRYLTTLTMTDINNRSQESPQPYPAIASPNGCKRPQPVPKP